MEYKYEYKDITEREDILTKNKELFWIEEQNITEGNFLIFSEVQPQPIDVESQEANDRISDISTYLNNSDETTILNIENSILEVEKNKIINGGM
ncbi:hypothetical protein [uncultured Clostridium sp.]|uniref:hypothetical protein n=1 Tax=uncultured Clostridium sp. TaxID=59620 RepID=UPI0028F099A6|nr:hypothetical protein [uncultured Clostridium sp.]